MHSLLLAIDPYVIWFYRLTGHAFPDFLIGTFVLAFATLLIGEICISVVFLICRQHIDRTTAEMVRYQNLSEDAQAAGNQDAYRASNKLANDAFGRTFFMQIAFSAAFLWPIFFALTWMGSRFSDVEFPLLFTGASVTYVCVFIPLYAAAYLGFKRVKNRLPYFRTIKRMLDSSDGNPRDLQEMAVLRPASRQTTV